MNDGALVIAYHGCDVTVRDRLIRGTLRQLSPSANRYDWLGSGVYFFEGDAERALDFATTSCERVHERQRAPQGSSFIRAPRARRAF
ncbi:hypothetical protein [Roseateles sp.]|uniref:hypothetical protein n=1 Tax=Roseateles sp. TaxID=1971397 RepID=UPI0031D2FB9D